MNNGTHLLIEQLKLLAGHTLDFQDKINVGSFLVNYYKQNGTDIDSTEAKGLFTTILAKSYESEEKMMESFDNASTLNYQVKEWTIKKILKRYLEPDKLSEQTPEQSSIKVQDEEVPAEMATILVREADKYISVATDYYRLSHILNARRQSIPVQQLWRKSVIVGDYGKEILRYIKQYVSFVNIPDNSETYQKEHIEKGDACYNLYEQLRFVPAQGDVSITLKFLTRIFQDKIEIILDYLKLLYVSPTQSLPVICLVSKVQETGKSTYMRWICSIFGRNAIILGNEEFSTNFNSLYASKLIVCIDESFIDKTIIKEKIKRLTTSDSINMEAKGRDTMRMDFFGKLVLSSNTEDNFIKMDDDDNRFFVVRVPALTADDYIQDLMIRLEAEIPAFLYFLKTRQMVHENKSRLWFDPKLYETEALNKLRINTRSHIQKELIRWCEDIFGYPAAGDLIKATPVRLAQELEKSLKQVPGLASHIGHILKDEWQLPISPNGKFDFPTVKDEYDDQERMNVSKISFTRTTGTYYIITRQFIESKNNFLQNPFTFLQNG